VYSRGGVIAVLLFCFWPLTALGGWLALSFGDPALEDWARLHTGPAQVALRVTLPLAAPGLFAGAAAVFLFSLAEFGAPEALRALLTPLGLDPRDTVIAYCQSATRSAVLYYGLLQLGFDAAQLGNYGGSWAEYSRLDEPLATGAL